MRNKGFTLIELMIVVAIIAIIAAIAIPGLLRARISANESSSIGTLRSISTSEVQFQQQAVVDQDIDGTGEYGTLNELAGTATTRPDQDGNDKEVDPVFISAGLAPDDNQITASAKSGYFFQVFLPGTGTAVTDTGTTAGALEADAVVIDLQEQKFRIYSWPASFESTGIRTFAVDQTGEVIAANNDDGNGDAVFEGANSQPNFDDAVEAGESSGDSAIFDGNFKIGTLSTVGLTYVAAG